MNAHRKEWPLGSYFIEVSRLGQRLSAVFPKNSLNFYPQKKQSAASESICRTANRIPIFISHGTALQPFLEGLYQAEPQGFQRFSS
jgi:hypothetical protein